MTTKNDNDSTRSIAKNRPSDGTAVVPDDSDDVPRRLGRRTFVKGLGATAAGGLGVKYGVQDADALALTTAALIGVAAGAAGGVAFGMTFGGPDGSEVATALDYQAHVNEFTRAREDRLLLDQTLSSLQRDVQLVENKAREQAIFNIYEQGVDSGSEADATAAAEKAINDAYATVEKAILNSWNIRALRMKALLDLFGSHYQTPAFKLVTDSGSTTNAEFIAYGGSYPFETATVTLLDGSTAEEEYFYRTQSSGEVNVISPRPSRYQQAESHNSGSSETFGVGYRFYAPDPSNYSVSSPDQTLSGSVDMALTKNWQSIYSDLLDAHSAMMGEVSSMVSSYYQPAKDGEIDLYEAVGPSHLTNTAQTATDYQEAAMALRAMGYPMSEQVVTIAVPTEGGGTQELTGRLSWTAHQGNSLDVGVKHGPKNIPGSIYAAVNVPDGIGSLNSTNTTNTTSTDTGPGAEIIELVGEFEILEAGGADGVTFKDRSLAEADATSNEEINKIFKENYDANKEATETVHDTATGGGGGLSWSGLTSMEKGIALVAAGFGAWILTGDD